MKSWPFPNREYQIVDLKLFASLCDLVSDLFFFAFQLDKTTDLPTMWINIGARRQMIDPEAGRERKRGCFLPTVLGLDCSSSPH